MKVAYNNRNIYVNKMWTTWYLMCMTKQKDVPVIRTNNLNPKRKSSTLYHQDNPTTTASILCTFLFTL